MSYSLKLDGNPDYSTVLDGKLYVFVKQSALNTFSKDQLNVIEQANSAWLDIRSISAMDFQ